MTDRRVFTVEVDIQAQWHLMASAHRLAGNPDQPWKHPEIRAEFEWGMWKASGIR